MCGIFGATDHESFYRLARLNSQRGDYATSVFFPVFNGIIPIKRQGSVEKNKDLFEQFLPGNNSPIFLGHLRAPTAGLEKWNDFENHPFNIKVFSSFSQDFLWLAHNGIIHNDKQLREKYLWEKTPVTDSYCILLLLSQNLLNDFPYIDFKCLRHLDGIFACWLYDTRTRNTYVFRNVSSVFYNREREMFSSVEFEDSEILPAGKVFTFPEFEIIDEFTYESPYYVSEEL